MKIVKLYAKEGRQHDCPECNELLLSDSLVGKIDNKYYHQYCGRIKLLHVAGVKWIKRNFKEYK